MHFQIVLEQTAIANQQFGEKIQRVAEIAGVEDVESKISPEVPATIRLYDPAAHELYLQQARVALLDEIISNLESKEEAAANEATATRQALEDQLAEARADAKAARAEAKKAKAAGRKQSANSEEG